MAPSPSLRETLIRLLETLVIGAIGGAALGLAKFPAGWLSGAIISVAIAALARRPVRVPLFLGQCANIVLGISLGASVTPESVARMGTWPASLAILALAMACGSAVVVFYLHKVHDWDVLSALFASSPGGLSQALALAAETGADLRSVAMVQAMRVLVLSAGLPLCFAAFGITGTRPVLNPAVATVASMEELALLVVAAIAGGLIAYRLRFPGGLLVGAMAASGVLHATGLVKVNLPLPAAIVAFIVMGSIIGARFAGTDIWLLRRLTLVGLGALAVGTAVASVFAVAAALLLSLPVGDVVMAFAPGALEAMTTLAFALNLDPAYVGTHHIARLIFVSLVVPVVVHAIRRRTAAKPAVADPVPDEALQAKAIPPPRDAA
jgi:membrane AbrB-like protein